MVRKITVGILLLLTVVLAACGSGEGDTTDAGGDASQTAPPAQTPRARPFDDTEMPLSMKLPVGTLMLEETPHAVTPAQAEELLPLWQMLRALQESGTASQVEIEAVLDQIQAAMTPEQLAAIDEMSREDMQALFQELGMRRLGDSETGEGGGFRPPEGMMPPGGGEGGGFRPPEGMMPPGGGEGRPPGMGPGGFGDLSPEERATVMAERGGMGMRFGAGMTDAVIELLEMRAAES